MAVGASFDTEKQGKSRFCSRGFNDATGVQRFDPKSIVVAKPNYGITHHVSICDLLFVRSQHKDRYSGLAKYALRGRSKQQSPETVTSV